ncbi:MAG: endoribonuclease YicC domain-containing protein, partial [Porphyromonas sp.]
KEEWEVVRTTTLQAIEELQAFRLQEGKMLREVCALRIEKISALLRDITFPEAERITAIRQRLEEGLAKIAPAGGYDSSRLEQEMIYYIEKLDINEEKSRLAHHLSYFLEVLDADAPGQGKTLGFIAQEIGREINTMGSKSNQAEMQQIVVKMKDELEQIKEQVLNIL